MGNKQTKIDGQHLPDTPTLQRIKQFSIDNHNEREQQDPGNLLDPRSPLGFRTPIRFRPELMQMNDIQQNTDQQNPFMALRKRFLKGFMYNLNDPRSPHLNRTPLEVEDPQERTLNLDDTFADLMVESHGANTVEGLTNYENQFQKQERNKDISAFMYVEEETLPCEVVLQQGQHVNTPIHQQSKDPRSPTFGVDRTPLIFSDDNNDEGALVENLLEALNVMDTDTVLNEDEKEYSSEMLMSPFASSVYTYEDVADETQEEVMMENMLESLVTKKTITEKAELQTKKEVALVKRPTNKHLERVTRNGSGNKNKRGVPKKRGITRIYENDENVNEIPTTPKQAKNREQKDQLERTPLSNVKNRQQDQQQGSFKRSRSVEMSAKSMKTRLAALPLTSFDDNLYN